MAAAAAEPVATAVVAATEAKVNEHMILCQWCDCKVLRSGHGVWEEKPFDYPYAHNTTDGQPSSETLAGHWRVDDRFAFENVGVARPHNAEQANFRYLTCADCERGPIGLSHDLQTFYVADSRVRHEPPSASAPAPAPAAAVGDGDGGNGDDAAVPP